MAVEEKTPYFGRTGGRETKEIEARDQKLISIKVHQRQ